MSETLDNRNRLRRLSELRVKAGLPPFPTVEELNSYAVELNTSTIEAHKHLMEIGEQVLEPEAERK